MPTLSVQPGSLPMPKKECLKYCIIPFEAILDEGVQAEASIEFDGTAYSAGQSFIFAGQEFTTSVSTIAFDRFPITANEVDSAQAFKDALELNVYFFGNVDIVISTPAPGTRRVTVTWKANGEQPDWDFDYSGMTPAPPHSEANGVAPVIREGFKLRYQLWAENADGIFAVTNIESITPRITEIGSVPRLCFDFAEDVQGLVQTTLPELEVNDITEDETFKINLFLKFGGIQVDNCVITEFDFVKSNVCTLYNSCVQIDDEGKLKPYFYPEQNPAKILTARPSAMKIRSDAYYWLWVITNHLTESSTFDKYRVFWTYKDSAGLSIGTFSSATEPATDGVYYFPAGPMNCPGIPPGTVTIEVKLEVWQNVFEAWQAATETKIISINNSGCQPAEFHFLEDLGAYSIIYASEPEEVTHEQDFQVFTSPENCPEDIYARDHVVSRVRTGGRSRSNIQGRKVFKCKIEGLDKDDQMEWFRQFLDSENILHRYTTAEGITVLRKIIIDAGETLLTQEGYPTVNFTFRYHTDLR